MRKIIGILAFCFMLSCSKGIWVSEGRYRPKNPNFSILKKEFIKSDLIDNRFFYISQKRTENYDGKMLYSLTGFYEDGRLIGNTITEQNFSEEFNATNTWETASSVGYYRIDGEKLEMQFFVPTDGGLYETRSGRVKKDTVFLERKARLSLNSKISYDTLVKSKQPLR